MRVLVQHQHSFIHAHIHSTYIHNNSDSTVAELADACLEGSVLIKVIIYIQRQLLKGAPVKGHEHLSCMCDVVNIIVVEHLFVGCLLIM